MARSPKSRRLPLQIYDGIVDQLASDDKNQRRRAGRLIVEMLRKLGYSSTISSPNQHADSHKGGDDDVATANIPLQSVYPPGKLGARAQGYSPGNHQHPSQLTQEGGIIVGGPGGPTELPPGSVGEVLTMLSSTAQAWTNPNPTIQRHELVSTTLGATLTVLPLGTLNYEDAGFFTYNAGLQNIQVLQAGVYDIQGVVEVQRTGGNPDTDAAVLVNGSVLYMEFSANLTTNVDEATLTMPVMTIQLAADDLVQVAGRDAGGSADATDAFIGVRLNRLV